MNEQSRSWADPAEGLSLRQPPSNLMAEQALLGALLSNNKMFDRVAIFLKPEHFADPVNGRVFGEIGKLIGAGRVADAVTLRSIFENSGILNDVGGTAYLAQLLRSTIDVISAGDYARVVLDAAIRRETIDVAQRLLDRAFGGLADLDATKMVADAIAELDAAAALSPSLAGFTTLDAAMDGAIDRMERAARGEVIGGVSTGFQQFDARLGGLEPGLVYVIGGRPGMGKSSIGHQIAINAARAGVGVLEFSLEMSAAQLGRRTLATAARVSINTIQRGRQGMSEAAAIVRARKDLAGLPLSIDDAGGQTASQLAAKARAAQRKHGLGLIMVDHLNLMRPEDQDAKHGGTWATERASAAMLQLAKDTACPVLLLAQLNRGVEAREDKRPTLSDLRQAGAIEQDAYAVGFVYRPEYYLGGEPEPQANESPAKHAQRVNEWHNRKATLAGKGEMIWAKVRDGEAGTDMLTFHGPTATFGELEHG